MQVLFDGGAGLKPALTGMQKNTVIALIKPPGPSSFQIINKLKHKLKLNKTGHSGTLDPLATGLLLVGINEGTRLLEYCPKDKRYRAYIKFGISTTTLDTDGDIVDTVEPDKINISRDNIEKILPKFLGAQKQIPPIYSAIKQGGKAAYHTARAGEDIELEARSVEIYSLNILDWDAEKKILCLDCHVSEGTYIRSLARDIAAEFNLPAHLDFLIRTQIGDIMLQDALFVDEINNIDDIKPLSHQRLISLPSLEVSDEIARRLDVGQRITYDGLIEGQRYAIFQDEQIKSIVGYNNNILSVIKNF
jgi:tRNA pseudouridine55 synthase